jgi:hypothetical protein
MANRDHMLHGSSHIRILCRKNHVGKHHRKYTKWQCIWHFETAIYIIYEICSIFMGVRYVQFSREFDQQNESSPNTILILRVSSATTLRF